MEITSVTQYFATIKKASLGNSEAWLDMLLAAAMEFGAIFVQA